MVLKLHKGLLKLIEALLMIEACNSSLEGD
jgi:hypothetical protein